MKATVQIAKDRTTFKVRPHFLSLLSEGDHQLRLDVRQSAFLESPPA
jgi:hypothetical protein